MMDLKRKRQERLSLHISQKSLREHLSVLLTLMCLLGKSSPASCNLARPEFRSGFRTEGQSGERGNHQGKLAHTLEHHVSIFKERTRYAFLQCSAQSRLAFVLHLASHYCLFLGGMHFLFNILSVNFQPILIKFEEKNNF